MIATTNTERKQSKATDIERDSRLWVWPKHAVDHDFLGAVKPALRLA